MINILNNLTFHIEYAGLLQITIQMNVFLPVYRFIYKEQYELSFSDFTSDIIIQSIITALAAIGSSIVSCHFMSKKNLNEKYIDNMIDSYNQLTISLADFILLCSQSKSTQITYENVESIVHNLESNFLKLQALFRSPFVINDDKMQKWLGEINDNLSKINQSIMDAYNNMKEVPLYPIDSGCMMKLTRIQKELNSYVETKTRLLCKY